MGFGNCHTAEFIAVVVCDCACLVVDVVCLCTSQKLVFRGILMTTVCPVNVYQHTLPNVYS